MFNLRKVHSKDIFELQKIGKETFLETFGSDNLKSDMDVYLNSSFNINQLNSELKNPESRFYFAEFNNTVIGYLKVNIGAAQSENMAHDFFEIERIYVISNYQGKKVGRLLFDKALELAKEQCAKHIWLGVWEENPKAIKFYKKNGFVVFGSHKFILGMDEQTDVMMKLALN